VARGGGRALVRRAGARMVPEAAVFGPDGQRKYLGRIDDLYADLGKRRARATSRDLRDALDAVLADRPVPRPVTQAVGCFIPSLSSKDPSPASDSLAGCSAWPWVRWRCWAAPGQGRRKPAKRAAPRRSTTTWRPWSSRTALPAIGPARWRRSRC